jgi:hypothetical protein
MQWQKKILKKRKNARNVEKTMMANEDAAEHVKT